MRYGEIKKCDIANGEGVRVSLFVSGCTHHCKGCFNEATWDFDYGKEFTQETEEEILKALEPEYVNGKELSIQGKHTYLYAPGSEENISDVIKHLHHAGVITLLLVEEKYASTVRIASEEYYHVLPEDIKVETDEIVKYIDELSAYDVRVAGNGEFI